MKYAEVKGKNSRTIWPDMTAFSKSVLMHAFPWATTLSISLCVSDWRSDWTEAYAGNSGRERESVSHTNALPYYTTILYIMIKFHRWLRPLTVRKNETRYRQRYRPVVAAAAVVMALAPNGLSFFFVLHTHSSTGGTKWRRFGESISRSSM